MTYSPSHFTAVLLFALFASVVFGITQRNVPRTMLKYGAWCFSLFIGAAIVLSWVMYFLAK